MYSRLVCNDQKTQKLIQTKKSFIPSNKQKVFLLASISNILSDQRSSGHQEAWFSGGDKEQMDIVTYRLNQHMGLFNEN